MHERYIPESVERKWQARWEESRAFTVEVDPGKPKFYQLEMLPYPSGRIHIGHVRNYSIGDALAWYKRLKGFNVLHPIGWDAFGMPAENAAIKNGARPDEWTFANIATMRSQLKAIGFSYDWSREIASCTPEYYRWNQWFFIKMFEAGLVYRKNATVNWCRKCMTSLANEQAEGGFCWRHEDTPVEKRNLEQWFVRLTKYNEELLAGIDGVLKGTWPERVLTMQRNWIGRSEGAFVDFALEHDPATKIRVFTTRIDTIHGASACILAPEHPLVAQIAETSPNREAIDNFVARISKLSFIERTNDTLEKEGVDTGARAVNPFTGKTVPVWIANFVLAEYGTGAIMSVPAHDERDFEFTRKYRLPLTRVIWPIESDAIDARETLKFDEIPFTGPGILGPFCGEFSGLTTEEARRRMAAHAAENGFGEPTVTYRIRDWGISRQRAWGTPIPMIHCDQCGIVPAPLESLPVELPKNLDFSLGSPLSHSPEYVAVPCPACGGTARRDTDTMDTFVDSNWYYFRYCDPKNDRLPFDPAVVNYWMPVDFYIGGIEHAVLHLIYTRVWSMILRDLGLTGFGEPVKSLLTQGMVILNGAKMSKSLGNVVDPDEMVRRYGADATRLSILFAAPPEKEVDWKEIKDDNGYAEYPAAEGALRYLARVWRLIHKWHAGFDAIGAPTDFTDNQRTVRRVVHQAIKRVSEAYEDGLRLNVTVAACMELTNALYDFDGKLSDSPSDADRFVLREGIETLVLLLAPLAPHLAEECWEALGNVGGLTSAGWPTFDPILAREEQLEIPVQINGKLRVKLTVAADISEDDLKAAALADAKVQATLAGKDPTKIVYVPKRLINIVVKG